MRVILFVYGASQFFVDPEPGLPEFLFPLLLILVTQRALLHPAILLLLAGNLMALVVELLVFHTATWSLVSVYMTLTAASIVGICTRYDFYSSIHTLVLGGAAGAAITLAVLATPFSAEVYRYGIRFTGFFKDPNVTAPTALFFAIILLAFPGRSRWLAVAPAIVFAMALSRATYLAAATALVYAVAFRNRVAAVFGAGAIALGAAFYDQIGNLIDGLFASLGRQGLVNAYDDQRLSNWQLLLSQAADQLAPLGPGFSEANGMSMHSTYLRLLVEQGVIVLVMFLAALWMSLRTARSTAVRAALIAIAANGVVIDATHWRVLFLAIAVALAWRHPIASNHASNSQPVAHRPPWGRRQGRRSMQGVGAARTRAGDAGQLGRPS